MSTLAVANISGLNIGSPVNFFVSPIMPTPTIGDSSNKAATTSFVMSAVTALSTSFSFNLGSTLVLANTTVSELSSLSIDNSPIGSITPSSGNFTGLYGTVNAGSYLVSRYRAFLQAGTVSAPGIAFGDEIALGNTGLFEPVANAIGVANNGVETFRFVAGGPPQVIAAIPANDNSTNVASTAFVQTTASTSNFINGSHRDLVIYSDGASNSVYVSAKDIVLKSSTGAYLAARNFSTILDLSTVGLNGRDSGSLTTGTLYSLWVMSNGTTFGVVGTPTRSSTGVFTLGSRVIASVGDTTGMSVGTVINSYVASNLLPPGTFITNIAGTNITVSNPCIDPSAAGSVRTIVWVPAPTLAGYTYACRIGMLYTNATTAAPVPFTQIDSRFNWTIRTTFLPALPQPVTGTSSGSDVTTPAWANVSLLNYVPPTAKRVHLTLMTGSSGCALVAPSSLYGGYNSNSAPPFVANATYGVSTPFDMPLESFNVAYASNVSTARLFVRGWEDTI